MTLSRLEVFSRSAAEEPANARALFGLLYTELRRLAWRHLGKQGGCFTLGPTTLLHEAFVRMAGPGVPVFSDRARFFVYASRVMHTIAIDYARSQKAYKRNRQLASTLPDDDALSAMAPESGVQMLKLETALRALTGVDSGLAELVDLHFFGGLTFLEIASLRHVSERTVQREWHKARLLLHHFMSDP